MDDFEEVSSYRRIFAAELARSALETGGVECFLSGHDTFSVGALCDPDIGRIKLMVNSCDMKKAKEMLGITGDR
ncbi:MAG: hypothetical protein PHO00_07155 [bacterium]|nr:hypothetical protein [bacterium]